MCSMSTSGPFLLYLTFVFFTTVAIAISVFSSTLPLFVNAIVAPQVTSAFTFDSGYSSEDLTIFGSVPDNGGTSVIANLTFVKFINISVYFGRNTKLVIRNVHAEVGVLIAGWLSDGVEIEVTRNILAGTSGYAPALKFAPRILGEVTSLIVANNRMNRVSAIADATRSILYLEPYVLEASVTLQKISNVTIYKNSIECFPFDGGKCTGMVLVPPLWLNQPKFSYINVTNNFFQQIGFLIPYPPQLMGLNFSVTSEVKSLYIFHNDIHEQQGANLVGIALLNARGVENITIHNNTVRVTPVKGVTGNATFLIVGRPALDQLGNETNSTATQKHRERIVSLSVTKAFIISNNTVTCPYRTNTYLTNSSWGIFLVDLHATRLLKISNNFFNVSASSDASKAIYLANLSGVDEILLDNNTISCGGDSSTKNGATTTMIEFRAPLTKIPVLSVSNCKLETWGGIPRAYGILFGGGYFSGVAKILIYNITANTAWSFIKTFSVVHFGNFKSDVGSNALEQVTVDSVTVMGKEKKFDMLVVVNVDVNSDIDVKIFKVMNCRVNVTAAGQLVYIYERLIVSDAFLLVNNFFSAVVTGSPSSSSNIGSGFLLFHKNCTVQIECDVEIYNNTVSLVDQRNSSNSSSDSNNNNNNIDVYFIELASAGITLSRKIIMVRNFISLTSTTKLVVVVKLPIKAVRTYMDSNTFYLVGGDTQASVVDVTDLSRTSLEVEIEFTSNFLSVVVKGSILKSNSAALRVNVARAKSLDIRNNEIEVNGGSGAGVSTHITGNFDIVNIRNNKILCTAGQSGNGSAVGVFISDGIAFAVSSALLNLSLNAVTLGCPAECFLAQVKNTINASSDAVAVDVEIKHNTVVFSETKLKYMGSLLMLKSEGKTRQNFLGSASFDPTIDAKEVSFTVNNNSVRVDDNESLSDTNTKVALVQFNAEVGSNNDKMRLEVESNSLTRGNGFKGLLALVCFHCTHDYLANSSTQMRPSALFKIYFNSIYSTQPPLYGHGAAFLLGSVKGRDLISFPVYTKSYNMYLRANKIFCADCIASGSWIGNYSGRMSMKHWSIDASAPCNEVVEWSSSSRRRGRGGGMPLEQRHFEGALSGANISTAFCGSSTVSPSQSITGDSTSTASRTKGTPTLSDSGTLSSDISTTATLTESPSAEPATLTKSETNSPDSPTPSISATINITDSFSFSDTVSKPSGSVTAPATSTSTLSPSTVGTLSSTFTFPTRSLLSDTETSMSRSLDWVQIPLPGLNPDERKALAIATGSVLTFGIAVSPTPVAGLGASRGLAVFYLLGCRENDFDELPWTKRRLAYPFSLLPGVGFGDEEEGHFARAAVVSFAIPIAVAFFLASLVGYVRVSKTNEKLAEIRKKQERENRRESRKKIKAFKDRSPSFSTSIVEGTHELLLAFESEHEEGGKKSKNDLVVRSSNHNNNNNNNNAVGPLWQQILIRSPYPDFFTHALSIFAGSLPVGAGILLGLALNESDKKNSDPERSSSDFNLAVGSLCIMAGIVLMCCAYCTVVVYSKDGPKLTEAAVYYSSDKFPHKWSARCLYTKFARWAIVHPKIYDVRPGWSSPEATLRARRFVQRMRMFLDFWGPEAELDELTEELDDQRRARKERVRFDQQRRQRTELMTARVEAEMVSEPLLIATKTMSTVAPQDDYFAEDAQVARRNCHSNRGNDDDEEDEGSDDDDVDENEDPSFRNYRNDLMDEFFQGSPAYLCHINEFSTRWQLAEVEKKKKEMQARMRNNNNNNNNNSDEDDEEMASHETKSNDDEQEQDGDDEVESDSDDSGDDFEIETKIHRSKCQQFIAVNYIGISFLATFVVALLQGYAFVSSSSRCNQFLNAICGINIFMFPFALYVRPCLIPIDNALLLFVEFCTFLGSMLALFVPAPPPLSADINTATKILGSGEYEKSHKFYMITQLSLTASGLIVSLGMILVGITRFLMLIASQAQIISIGSYRKRVAQEIAHLNIFKKKKVDEEGEEEGGKKDVVSQL